MSRSRMTAGLDQIGPKWRDSGLRASLRYRFVAHQRGWPRPLRTRIAISSQHRKHIKITLPPVNLPEITDGE